jgi:hypothetical protein
VSACPTQSLPRSPFSYEPVVLIRTIVCLAAPHGTPFVVGIEIIWKTYTHFPSFMTETLLSELFANSSIQTTERYLSSEQEIVVAVNDNLGL